MSQQIFAKIKKSSKYYAQQPMSSAAKPVAFEVFLDAQTLGAYVVHGRPGQYRLVDVNLFVVCESGRELKIA